jgi:hypothetical protein
MFRQFGSVLCSSACHPAFRPVRRAGVFTQSRVWTRAMTSAPRKWDLFEADASMFLPETSTSKLVVFVRHAEGLHNAAHRENEKLFWEELWNSPKLWDAPLTDLGKEQVGFICGTLESHHTSVRVSQITPILRRACEGQAECA